MRVFIPAQAFQSIPNIYHISIYYAVEKLNMDSKTHEGVGKSALIEEYVYFNIPIYNFKTGLALLHL